MRFILSTACLFFSLGAGAAPQITGDCDKLEANMRLSDQAGQRTTCTATAVTSTGQRVTKTFTAYVKKVPQVGNRGEATESVVIDETCQACQTTGRYLFGLGDFGKIRDTIAQSVASSADGLDEDAAVQTQLAEGLENCALDQSGRPTNLQGAGLLQCRVNMLMSKDAESGTEYYRRWLQPELERLVRAHDPAMRDLGKRALQLIDTNAGQQNVQIHESLKDMGHFLYYRTMIEAMGQQIEAAGPNPQLRTVEVQRLGQLQRQWTRTYQQRREQAKAQGVLDQDLETHSKVMEGQLNQMYGQFGVEIKQAQTGGGTGRTMFGQPQASGQGTVPAKPATVPGRATPPASPPTPASPTAPAQSFNQQILRPR